MSKIIEKKILPQYFRDVINGNKSFELRKDEDNIQSGDTLILKEWDGERYTGNQAARLVTYVLRDAVEYGLMDGYCIIGIEEKREVPSAEQEVLDNVMTTTDVGDFLKVSRQTINAWQKEGLLLPFRAIRSGNLYYRPDVIAFRDTYTGYSMKGGRNKG